MANGSADSGCGCLVLILLAFVIGGGFWEGIGILAVWWLLILVFVGVSEGIVAAIIKAISGD
jgi:hypothetical protein